MEGNIFPDEIMMDILGNVSSNELLQFCQTSKYNNILCQEDELWGKMYINKFAYNDKILSRKSWQENFVFLHRIVDDKYLRSVMPYFVDAPTSIPEIKNISALEAAIKCIIEGKNMNINTGGRTILTKAIARELILNNYGVFPIYLPLHQIIKPNSSLWSLTQEFYALDDFSLQELRIRRIVWILDGTNVIPKGLLSTLRMDHNVHDIFVLTGGSLINQCVYLNFERERLHEFVGQLYNKLTSRVVNNKILDFVNEYFTYINRTIEVQEIYLIIVAYIYLEELNKVETLDNIMNNMNGKPLVAKTQLLNYYICYHITRKYGNFNEALKYLIFLTSFCYSKFNNDAKNNISKSREIPNLVGYIMDDYVYTDRILANKASKTSDEILVGNMTFRQIIQSISDKDINKYINDCFIVDVIDRKYLCVNSVNIFIYFQSVASFLGLIGIKKLSEEVYQYYNNA
ncbi:F-box domain-containing protein [Orpheovirus IHUMI-LCC2]|uniref:F-box domain-containing protein n=1 Tax=Orpheovirus IHUMI-LCC2 TaxID=2023057 RepID=A0A2I2L4Y2_9VIRU|nr:F-box domain-containing protein [Orpheovirus IHUMI-LCC2]SNW62593.1 F-box domain-containing protein [Orpheovirus IHUMI-LCC2]